MQFCLPTQAASASPCPDIEVMFARGTGEAPGLGVTGTSFVEALRVRADGKSVGSYAVDYPASNDFLNPVPFARTVMDGVRDSRSHVEFMATHCPGTRIVLGGYSQGGAVAGFTTMGAIPPSPNPGYAWSAPAPMPAEVAGHVAAVVLFGTPSDRWQSGIGAPPIVLGPAYAAKSTWLCVPGDTICNGAGAGLPNAQHTLYSVNGMADQAAGFVTSRL
ncbi:cutinase family protein [Rhodococcus sp. NPDC058521]|uniref:cutinase family protein n=1 Tax=Rhodococcus sp. NPDC058521 TaxID=3346536 RepID=UPI00366161C1